MLNPSVATAAKR
jgi:hypothetical protein